MIGAVVVCTLIVIFVPNLDPKFMEAIYGLGITAALGLDQWIKNSGDNAPPTIAAVNDALNPTATASAPVGAASITSAVPARSVAPPSQARKG